MSYYFDTAIVNRLQSIGYKKGNNAFRFFLKVDTKIKSSKVAIVVMKNPAKACRNNLCINRSIRQSEKIESDLTINNVIKKLMDYESIIILNLYVLMDSNPKNINTFYSTNQQSLHDKNKNIIIETIRSNKNAKIFCAWGQNSTITLNTYTKTVCDFLKFFSIRNVPLGEFDGSKIDCWKPLTTIFPLHASKW